MSVSLYHLRIPLIKPYHLSFGDVTHYEIIAAELHDGTRSGIGEANIITGYTDETIAGSWQAACEFAPHIANLDPVRARHAVLSFGEKYPFTACAFGTALEMIEANPRLDIERETRVPILGLLNATEEGAIAHEVDALLGAGYRTFKIKVGFEPVADAAFVARVQRAVKGRARIRIDANQGYSADQGVMFARAIAPDDIELFEQPCAAGDWDAHMAVARVASVPMMLDESIYGLADIDRAAQLKAAAYIKVKLMKLVTLDQLASAIERIRDRGMTPVLGNGVACDLGCWLEACVAATHIDNAGEMNGWLKPRANLLCEPVEFRDGALWLKPGYQPRLDHARIAPFIVEQFSI